MRVSTFIHCVSEYEAKLVDECALVLRGHYE